jgi:hypothetical protein
VGQIYAPWLVWPEDSCDLLLSEAAELALPFCSDLRQTLLSLDQGNERGPAAAPSCHSLVLRSKNRGGGGARARDEKSRGAVCGS